MRAHPETIVPSASWQSATPEYQDARPLVLLAVDPLDVSLFGAGPFTRVLARNTEEAVRVIDRQRPRLAVLDLDLADMDGLGVCTAAAAANASTLVMTAEVERVPPALKAGCDAVLLKPFAPNLLATRLARLLREIGQSRMPRAPHANGHRGTNRVWADTRCPTCGAPGATSFDFSSYRRMWYACLSCEAVWLGKRQE
jgi:DNA-binding response OmpR family regulator